MTYEGSTMWENGRPHGDGSVGRGLMDLLSLVVVFDGSSLGCSTASAG